MKQPLVLDLPSGKLTYAHKMKDQLVYRGNVMRHPVEVHVVASLDNAAVYPHLSSMVPHEDLVKIRDEVMVVLNELDRAALLPKEMPLQPLEDKVLLRPLKEAEQTEGGIVLTDETRERTYRAEVVAIGPGRMLSDGKYVPLTVQVGDEVIYAKYAGVRMEWDGEEIILLSERDIHARIMKGEIRA